MYIIEIIALTHLFNVDIFNGVSSLDKLLIKPLEGTSKNPLKRYSLHTK